MDELLERVKAGDQAAEKQIFAILHVRFRSIAKRRVRDEGSAEDIAQDACVTVLEKYKTEEFTVSFEAWAYGVLRMKIGNYFHMLKTVREKLSAESEIEAMPGSPGNVDSEFKAKLLHCMKKILAVNSTYARALNLTYQGYKTDEICQKLGVVPSHFYVILNRGRSMLRLCLDKGEV